MIRSLSVARSLAALVLAAVACSADSATDPGKPASAEIAFGYSFDGLGSHTKLYLLDADGRVSALLPDEPNATWGPEWSPDGKQLLFSREVLSAGESTIWLAEADGSSAHALPGDPRSVGPRWSSDGARVFFVQSGGGGTTGGIGSVRLDGSDLQWLPLPADATTYLSAPALSPDGRRVAILRPSGLFTTRVWVANLDGSELRQVSFGDSDSDNAPRWSPEGSRLVFSRELASENFHSIVVMVNADGTAERPLTAVTSEDSSDHNPIWSPDGQWILYEHWIAPPSAPIGARARCTIEKMPAAGGAPIDLLGAHATGSCVGLAWRSRPTTTPP